MKLKPLSNSMKCTLYKLAMLPIQLLCWKSRKANNWRCSSRFQSNDAIGTV